MQYLPIANKPRSQRRVHKKRLALLNWLGTTTQLHPTVSFFLCIPFFFACRFFPHETWHSSVGGFSPGLTTTCHRLFTPRGSSIEPPSGSGVPSSILEIPPILGSDPTKQPEDPEQRTSLAPFHTTPFAFALCALCVHLCSATRDTPVEESLRFCGLRMVEGWGARNPTMRGEPRVW